MLFDLVLGRVSEVLDRLSQQSSFAEAKLFQLLARVDVLINHMVDDGCLVRQSLHADYAKRPVFALDKAVVHVKASGVLFEVTSAIAFSGEEATAVRALVHIRSTFHS